MSNNQDEMDLLRTSTKVKSQKLEDSMQHNKFISSNITFGYIYKTENLDIQKLIFIIFNFLFHICSEALPQKPLDFLFGLETITTDRSISTTNANVHNASTLTLLHMQKQNLYLDLTMCVFRFCNV